MSDNIKLRRDTFASFPRLTFIDAAGGGHRPWNKRYAPRDSWANLEVTINTNPHQPGGGWVSFTQSDGFTTEGGNPTSRTVSMTLNQARARELYEALDKVFGSAAPMPEGQVRELSALLDSIDPVKVGCQVAFNTLPDATWFDVLGVDGFSLTVREAGTNYAEQTADKSMVKQSRAGDQVHA